MGKAGKADRDHFDVIASAMETSREEQIEIEVKITPGERMAMGFDNPSPLTQALLVELDVETDSQMELARRRITLRL